MSKSHFQALFFQRKTNLFVGYTIKKKRLPKEPLTHFLYLIVLQLFRYE